MIRKSKRKRSGVEAQMTRLCGANLALNIAKFAVASFDALKLEDKAAAFARYLIWGGMPLAVLGQGDRKRA